MLTSRHKSVTDLFVKLFFLLFLDSPRNPIPPENVHFQSVSYIRIVSSKMLFVLGSVVCSVVVTFVFWVHRFWHRNDTFWADRAVPYLPNTDIPHGNNCTTAKTVLAGTTIYTKHYIKMIIYTSINVYIASYTYSYTLPISPCSGVSFILMTSSLGWLQLV